MQKNWDCIIIGGGPAGLSASIYTRRGLISTLLINDGIPGGQINITEEIENYPALGKIKGPELAKKFEKHSREFNTEFLNARVLSVKKDKDMFEVKTVDEVFYSKTLIVATGSNPKKLGIKGEKEFTGKGVSYCATCDAPFYRGLDVVVIGGGNTAVEEAIYLTKFANSVTLVHRRDKLRADRIVQERAFKNEKIKFIWNALPQEIKGDKFVRKIVLKDKITGRLNEVKADGVFIFVGYEPQTEFLKHFDILDEKGYVKVNEKMESNVKGLFAAGDIVKGALKQVVVSAASGAVAGFYAVKFIEESENV